MLPPIPANASTVTLLVIVLTTKHYVADFLLQTKWIATGKEGERHWVMPLAAHAAGHAVLTLLIAAAVAPPLWWLSGVDFVVHFLVDRGKTTVGHAARLTPQDEKFWWLLGFDQYLHQLTNIAFAVILASG